MRTNILLPRWLKQKIFAEMNAIFTKNELNHSLYSKILGAHHRTNKYLLYALNIS